MTALLEYLDLVCNFFERDGGRGGTGDVNVVINDLKHHNSLLFFSTFSKGRPLKVSAFVKVIHHKSCCLPLTSFYHIDILLCVCGDQIMAA